MTGILTSGPDLFPGWVSIVFSVGLALGIVHHLPCLLARHGNRWFHAAHTAMAMSMIYMFLSMSYMWNWLPAAWQMWFFVATSLAIGVYLAIKLGRGQPVNFLWIPLLVQQAAMAYMWLPMMSWNAILVFVLVSWFAAEAFGWAMNLLPDDVRERDDLRWLPHSLMVKRVGALTAPARQSVVTDGAGALLEANAQDCHSHSPDRLVVSDWKDRTMMAVMALSMGYMFYGMQLLVMTMPTMMPVPPGP